MSLIQQLLGMTNNDQFGGGSKTIVPKGGKILGQGGYGCVYYPALKCNGKEMNTKKYASKLQDDNRNSLSEAKIGHIVMNIPNYSKYFSPVFYSCNINLNKINTNIIGKCEIAAKYGKPENNKFSEPEFKLGYIRYIENIDVDTFLERVTSKKLEGRHDLDTISAIRGIFNYLLTAFKLLQTKHIVHYDVKPDNMFIAIEKYRPIIIDFGLSFSIDECIYGKSYYDINPKEKKPNDKILKAIMTDEKISNAKDHFVHTAKTEGQIDDSGTKRINHYMDRAFYNSSTDYDYWCIDTCIVSFAVRNMHDGDVFSYKDLQTICRHYIRENRVIQRFVRHDVYGVPGEWDNFQPPKDLLDDPINEIHPDTPGNRFHLWMYYTAIREFKHLCDHDRHHIAFKLCRERWRHWDLYGLCITIAQLTQHHHETLQKSHPDEFNKLLTIFINNISYNSKHHMSIREIQNAL